MRGFNGIRHLDGVKSNLKNALLAGLIVVAWSGQVTAQCNACEADPNCTSSDGFPTLCPLELPSGTAGEPYETVITFFLPAEITDPGSGLVATLNSVAITNISGVPPGMDIELDDPDALYEPSSGQNSGCATLCGTPTFAGAFEIQINILAVVTALGFEQEVPEGFSLPLIVEPGAGGTSSFTFSPSAGCGEVSADFTATVFGEGNQITAHQWDFGAFGTQNGDQANGVLFDVPGLHEVTLETVIQDQVLNQVELFNTGGGGWDDFFGNPDPYFTLKDGNETVVYTSSTFDATTSGTWSGLGIVLNNPPYSIDFYDEDLLDGDDWLGWAPFSPNGPGAINVDANPSNAQLTIGLNPVVVVMDVAEVLVNPLPEVEIYQAGPNSLACDNDSLLQYQWYMDGMAIEGVNAPLFQPSVSGWYTVLGLDSSGCSASSDSLLFCLPNAPMALDLIEANGSPMALVTEADLDAWVWHFSGAEPDTVSEGGDTWFPIESGWYWVESESALGCPIVSDSLLVCWPLAAPTVTQDAEGNLVTEAGFAAYQWWEDDMPMAGEEGATLLNPGEGTYVVTVTDFVGCPAVESAATTYVGMATIDDHWSVAPNPFQMRLQLSAGRAWAGGEAVLMDLSGRVLERHALSGSPVSWDLGIWPAGTYLLRLKAQDGRMSSAQRVVKR